MILSAVTLAVLGQPPLAEFPLNGLKVEVTPKGTLRVVAPDGLSADLAVVLWHGDWVYVHQGGQGARQAEKAANAVSVSGELADAQGKAVLNFTQSIVLADNKLCVEYEFRPLEGSKIVRGPLLLMTVDRKAFSGRRQFIPPGIAGRIPARRTGAGNEYWLEIAPGAAVVVRMEKETAIESQPAGGRYETRFSLPLGEGGGGKVAFTLAAEQMPATLPGEVSGDDRPLAIRAVTPAQAKVPRFGLYEATIDLAATYRNPFDPDDVAVDAYFTSPSGRELVVPCFYMIDFKRDVIGDAERLEAGGATWKLRFTPEEIGRYRFRILARDRSGQVEWHGGALDVTPSQLPGFVRVARRSPRYLELSTGQGIFPIGHNLPTYHVSRFLPDRELKKMRDGGENYNRWWMYSRELGLEWEHEPGWYRQASAWRMDYLLRLAEELGFWYMICFDTHQDFLGSESWQGWPNNPYNASLGGPCEKPSDFFASPAAKALYKKRLRYLVARYGWSTRILCWEFGNEFEGWPDTPPDVLLAWHREMSDYLRSIDPYKHLITTSFWTPAGRQEIWELDSIDIVQTHHYANVKVDMARLVAADCAEKFKKYRKPHIYGEVGLDSRFRLEPGDPQGYWLHNAIWAALMSGAASAAMSWWHENYIDPNGLYQVYRGLARFVEQVPLSQYEWEPVTVASVRWLEKPDIAPGDITVAPLFGWGKPEVTRFEISPTGEVNDPGQVPSLLQGRGHPDLRTPVTFVVNYPQGGRFVVHVDRVSRSGLLRVFIDDQLVREFDLPCGEGLGKESVWREQWKLWETQYDEDFSVDVPAGKHEIRLENDGGDWVRVSSYKFIGARDYETPDHLVVGMASPRMLIAWVRNGDFTWFNAVEGKVKARPPAEITFAGVRPGRYRVEFWDTWEGRVTKREDVTAGETGLSIRVPRLENDVAIMATRME